MRKFVLSAVAVALLAVGGVANANTYDFSTFTLDADLSSFSGSSIAQSVNGFSFGGYNIGSTAVNNVIGFTITAKNGYKFDSMSFFDQGNFTGGVKAKFSVGDNFSDFSDFSDYSATVNNIAKTWTFAGNGISASGVIDYTLTPNRFVTGSASTGGAFSVVTAPVPEPESYAMLLAGLGLMGTIARRRSKSTSV